MYARMCVHAHCQHVFMLHMSELCNTHSVKQDIFIRNDSTQHSTTWLNMISSASTKLIIQTLHFFLSYTPDSSETLKKIVLTWRVTGKTFLLWICTTYLVSAVVTLVLQSFGPLMQSCDRLALFTAVSIYLCARVVESHRGEELQLWFAPQSMWRERGRERKVTGACRQAGLRND